MPRLRGPAPTPDASAGTGYTNQAVNTTLGGLTPGGLYHYRLAATNAEGTVYGADATFTTTAAPATPTTATPSSSTPGTATPPPSTAAPAPQQGKTVNVTPVSGTVLIRPPGSRTYTSLSELGQIPVGSIVDVTHGRVALCSAANSTGRQQCADFYGGAFRVTQRAGASVTDLYLVGGDFSVCGRGAHRLPGRRARSLARAVASRASRRLAPLGAPRMGQRPRLVHHPR